jgi:hypothetical protein
MVEFILIIGMYRGGVTNVPFESQQACESAKVQVMDDHKSRNSSFGNLFIVLTCVPRK